MCYADGGPMGHANELRPVCPYRNDVMIEAYDCDGENYYNPHPAPGSYLAGHWNLVNSWFMAPCAEDEMACGISQPEISTTARRIIAKRPVTLTLSAVTLANESVRVTASLAGAPRRASATVCLSSIAFASLPATCTKTSARRAPRANSGILLPADGEGWRRVSATVQLRGRRLNTTVRTALTLP